MNLQFYFEKLHDSDEFTEFMKENPSAYFCSGFFIIDKEENKNKINLDYFSPETKQTFSFQLSDEIKKIPLSTIDEKIPIKLSNQTDFNFDEIEEIIKIKMNEEKTSSKIQKIILSLQDLNGNDFLLGTVFISMIGLIKISISLKEKRVVDFEKKSLMDIMNVFKKK